MKRIALLFLISGILNASYNVKNEKAFICGVGKNIAFALPNMMKKMEQLGSAFADYRIVIYENNSTDNTVAILKEWAQRNSKVIIFSENLTAQEAYNRTKAHALSDNAPNRMEMIAYGRNKTLEKALEPQFDDFKFFIMSDMDFMQGWTIDGVSSSFRTNLEWDCITANGIQGDGTYYDRYTYRDEKFVLGAELIGEAFWHELHRTPFKITSQSFKKILAGFGGVAIYKKESIRNFRYCGYVTKDVEILMDFIINNTMPKNHPQYILYKSIINSSDERLPIIFQACCGYDSPVMCDHSPLQASMVLQGFDKIYLNPAMICQY